MRSIHSTGAPGRREEAVSRGGAAEGAARRRGASAWRLVAVLAALVAGCGGMVEQDRQRAPDATVREPLSIECADYTDCPSSFGYRTCGRNNRCTFRCDDHVHQPDAGTLTNAEECYARGGTCHDYGGGNAFCVAGGVE